MTELGQAIKDLLLFLHAKGVNTKATEEGIKAGLEATGLDNVRQEMDDPGFRQFIE